ncbi:hypothetical protein [Nocardia goodfellowii]|uniref:Uncharacterized protein n=1 Tax=Nocardia goodfellowii TaxID=882446 RepID=A0ABS4Q9R1_9NOCA|nr:hypothetical protein [Nocardia goodfellowii]MBP2188434.1 hypothetical protein [Nocardia goodfellowii]
MTDLESGGPRTPMVTDSELTGVSTPLRRAAGRLEAVLPPGWRVEVVDPQTPDGQPALRVVMPD